MLTREEALKVITRNNEPRYTAIKEYMDMIGIDYNETMSAIDKVSLDFEADKNEK